MDKIKIIAFFGHHKAATMWICAIFHTVAEILNMRNANYWDAKLFNYKLKEALVENKIEMFSFTNADYRYVSGIVDSIIGFHVVRDPRDICVSSYFSHLYSHPTEAWPELVEHRKKLQAVSKDEGILLEMDFRQQEFDEMFTWNYSNPNIMEIRMEDLIVNPQKMFFSTYNFLGLIDNENKPSRKISSSLLLKIIEDNSYSKKSGGRKPGEENIYHHYRRGVSGDWKNHFKDRHVTYFKERYNYLLIKLGYETKKDWEIS